MELTRAIFWIDALPGRYRGYENIMFSWNGASCPYFTKKQADLLAADLNSLEDVAIRYNTIFDRYEISYKGVPGAEFVEGFDMDTVDGVKHVYSIGAGSWPWMTEARPRKALNFKFSKQRKSGSSLLDRLFCRRIL